MLRGSALVVFRIRGDAKVNAVWLGRGSRVVVIVVITMVAGVVEVAARGHGCGSAGVILDGSEAVRLGHLGKCVGHIAQLLDDLIPQGDHAYQQADDQQLDPEYLAALGLPPQDAAAMQQVFEQFRADTVAQARDYYVELGGSPELAETIDPSELLGLVYGRTDYDGRESGRIAIAMERAGLAEAPGGELSPTESFVRWDAELGNRFEAVLAERFGAERAQQIRAKRGGWSGKRTAWADLCQD